MCEKILVQDPAARLGAGPKGEENGNVALRAHPFFEGLFAPDAAERTNDSGAAPYLAVSVAPPAITLGELPEPQHDGAGDDWMMDGIATELCDSDEERMETVLSIAVSGGGGGGGGGGAGGGGGGEEKQPVPETPHTPQGSVKSSMMDKWLEPGEKLVHQAMVSKRKGNV